MEFRRVLFRSHATQRQAVVRAQARLPFGRKRQPCAAEIAPDRIEQAHFVGNGADDPLIVANLGVDIGRGRTDREPLDHSGAQFQFGTLDARRSEAYTSELQSLMRSSYAVFCLKK